MPNTTTEKIIKDIVEEFDDFSDFRFVDKMNRKQIRFFIESSLTKLSESIKREMVEKVEKIKIDNYGVPIINPEIAKIQDDAMVIAHNHALDKVIEIINNLR